jgi:membrane associated rhomboid family serine protease
MKPSHHRPLNNSALIYSFLSLAEYVFIQWDISGEVDRTLPLLIAFVLILAIGLVVIFWRKFSIVLGLAVLIICAYILQTVGGSEFLTELALNPYYLTDGIHIYTIFSSMFLHAGLVHLIFNLFALIFIGMTVERKIGRLRFFLIFVIAGLIGSLTWAAMHWNQWVFAVGASGAIMGTLGAFARLFGKEKIRMFLFLLPMPPMPVYLIFVLLLIIDLVIALTSPPWLPIAAEAHIGGAVAGFLIAPLIMKVPATLKKPRQVRINLSTLRELATTDELREMLDKIVKETVPDIQLVWLDHFLKKARCPRCGKKIDISGSRLSSDCGWRAKL